jgi:hypothetical protein
VSFLALVTCIWGIWGSNSLAQHFKYDPIRIGRVNQSVSDQGIKFSIQKYSVDGNRLNVFYTIDLINNKKSNEPSGFLMEVPDIMVNNQKISSSNQVQTGKKISAREFAGRVETRLPINIPKKFKVTFNTDQILGQAGQWTIPFYIK